MIQGRAVFHLRLEITWHGYYPDNACRIEDDEDQGGEADDDSEAISEHDSSSSPVGEHEEMLDTAAAAEEALIDSSSEAPEPLAQVPLALKLWVKKSTILLGCQMSRSSLIESPVSIPFNA
jgi:hypothetical protein